MTKLFWPRRIYCCCSTCCCSSCSRGVKSKHNSISGINSHQYLHHHQSHHHRHVWRKTVVFGIFVFSLYFALLSFVSFLAVSNHRGPGGVSRGPAALLYPHLTHKNGSTGDSGFSSNSNSRNRLGAVGLRNGTSTSNRGQGSGGGEVGLITIEKTGTGSDAKYSLHSASSVSRRDAAFASDIIRSQTIFKCVPVHYRDVTGPSVALASFPGSGNTWLRYLLQLSTGIFTGSVYKDFALLRNGFPGESVTNGRVLVVKTHESGTVARAQFQKAILLVRKPSEAVLAEFNRRAAGHIGHAGRDKYTRNAGRYWSSFVAQKAKSWTETNLDWIERFTGALLITMYHQLVQNTSQELSTILDFLGEPVSDRVMNCVMSNKEGIYRRRKKNAQFNPFTSKMEKFLAVQERIVYNAIQRRMASDALTTTTISTPLSILNYNNHNNHNNINNVYNLTIGTRKQQYNQQQYQKNSILSPDVIPNAL